MWTCWWSHASGLGASLACQILRTPQQSSAKAAYLERINRAIDYVVGNLDRPLNLSEVAKVACFSPFHFHRIFHSLVGEPLSQFVNRLRLERALQILSHNPNRQLTGVALQCGFSSSSDFSRRFKKRYGVPPSVFDINAFRAQRRGDLQTSGAQHGARLERLPVGENPDGFEVELRSLPARTVAYVRVLESYREGAVAAAAARLFSWATARDLADGQWLGYMWDDPELVALKHCRYDVAVVVDQVTPEGEIGRFDFPAMTIAQVVVRGGIDVEMRAIDWLFGTWLPPSAYVPDSNPCFEAWFGRPFAHGMAHFELAIQLPVMPAPPLDH